MSEAVVGVSPEAARPPAPSGPDSVQLIEPSHGRLGLRFEELWRYRELLAFLAWRDVKVRYKQTVLGVAWAVLQPFLTMVVFSIFFGRFAGMAEKTGGTPYPIYVYAGLLPWTFFANAIMASSNSMIGSTHLVTKVYFPRLIIPLSAIGAGLVDLGISFTVLLALMAYYGTPISWQLLLLPLLLIGTVLAATGVGSLLSALIVSYRDFRYVIPFLIQLWLFITPVIYPVSIVPKQWQGLLFLNPMAGLVDGFRAAFLAHPMEWTRLAVSLLMAVLIFLIGTCAFNRVERQLADII